MTKTMPMPHAINALIAEKIMGLEVRAKQLPLKNGQVITAWDFYDAHPNVDRSQHKERRRVQFLHSVGQQAGIPIIDAERYAKLDHGPRWKPVRDYISAVELAFDVERAMFEDGYWLRLRRLPSGLWSARYFTELGQAPHRNRLFMSATEALCLAALDALAVPYVWPEETP